MDKVEAEYGLKNLVLLAMGVSHTAVYRRVTAKAELRDLVATRILPRASTFVLGTRQQYPASRRDRF